MLRLRVSVRCKWHQSELGGSKNSTTERWKAVALLNQWAAGVQRSARCVQLQNTSSPSAFPVTTVVDNRMEDDLTTATMCFTNTV